MSTGRLLTVFVAMLLLALVAFTPLKLLLLAGSDKLGAIAIRDVSGSVWDGDLRGVHWGPHDLDAVSIRLQLPPLMLGEQRWTIDSSRFNATLLRGRARGLRDANGQMRLTSPGDASPAHLELQDASLMFRDGRCIEATGYIGLSWQMTAQQRASLDHDGEIQLNGPLQCDGAVARVILQPTTALPAGIEAVEAQVTIAADGQYTVDTHARTPDPVLQLALQMAQFEPGPDGLVRRDRGQAFP